MKRWKSVLAFALALTMLLAMSACGGKSEDKSAVGKDSAAGFYRMIKMVENGEENADLSQLEELGIYMYLVLNEDGTGYTDVMGEQESYKWNDKEIWSDDANPVKYSYSNGTLTMEQDGAQLTYIRLTDDELKTYQEKGSAFDPDAVVGALTGTEDGDGAKSGEAVAQTWGDWSVTVPAGFEFAGGGLMDENDTRYFSVKESWSHYFDFSADGEENIRGDYDYNKNTYTNEQKDVQASFGGNDWTGFQYSDGYGGSGFEAYATVDGELIRVASAGYAFDDEVVKTVLGSLRFNGTPSDSFTIVFDNGKSVLVNQSAVKGDGRYMVAIGENSPIYSDLYEGLMNSKECSISDAYPNRVFVFKVGGFDKLIKYLK